MSCVSAGAWGAWGGGEGKVPDASAIPAQVSVSKREDEFVTFKT